MPQPKHVCRHSNSNTEPMKQPESHEYVDSDPESANSNSFHSSDSVMFANDVDGSDTWTSDEPSTSSPNWAATSSEISDYSSSEKSQYSSHIRLLTNTSQSFTNTSSTEPESLELGSCSTYCVSDYADKNLENLLIPEGGAPSSNFVLSSGRWKINQDADPTNESKNLTIDKEFEQYFSMLMLQ